MEQSLHYFYTRKGGICYVLQVVHTFEFLLFRVSFGDINVVVISFNIYFSLCGQINTCLL